MLTESLEGSLAVGFADTVIMAKTVQVPDECGSQTTTHQYLVNASGYASAIGGTGDSRPRVSISVDSTSMNFGPGFLLASVIQSQPGDTTRMPMSPMRVVSLDEGEHAVRVIGNFFQLPTDGTGQFAQWTMAIQDLGYTCS